jgi:two-component system, OmpR family, sensor kinase
MTLPADRSPADVVVTRASTRRAADVKPTRRSPVVRLLPVPARVRIMAWLVLLLFVALASVVVVTHNLLIADAHKGAAAALGQEIEEFRQAAEHGLDPATHRPFATGRDLLVNHIQRQYPDDDEILLGIAADGEVLAQPGRESITSAAISGDRLQSIVAAPEPTGILHTADGQLRWSKVSVLTTDGQPDGTFVVAYAIDRRIAEIGDAIGLLTMVSLIGLALAAGASWLVSGQILRPVKLVRRTAAEISHDDLTRRIPVHGNDDIAALSDQVNAMLERLEQAFATQRQFLDDASHELRTPITIIRGNLECIDGDDPYERTEVVRLCTDELDRMSRIVEDLLLLAKAERPDFVVPEIVGLVDLTTDIDAKLRVLGERRWQLGAIAEGDAWLDPQRITQAVVQLAHNAVQHTDDGDVILLGSAIEGDDVTFWVSDTGQGVRPEDAETIFQRFSRGAGPGRGRRTGAGLGLAIVNAIAEAHGGHVELDTHSGVGSTFTIVIPANGHSP